MEFEPERIGAGTHEINDFSLPGRSSRVESGAMHVHYLT